MLLVPLIAIGAAGLALLRPTTETAPSASGDGAASQEAPVSQSSGRWTTRVEWWRQYIVATGTSLPVEFLLRWIQRESDGDPASVGNSREVGIGQLYFDTGVSRLYGYSLDDLRASTHDPARLTIDQRNAQVESLTGLATDCLVGDHHAADTLLSLGLFWGDDALCVAKLWHNLPVLVSTYLPRAARDGVTDWDGFRAWCALLSLDDSRAIWGNAARYYGSGGKAAWERFTSQAEYVGRGSE